MLWRAKGNASFLKKSTLQELSWEEKTTYTVYTVTSLSANTDHSQLYFVIFFFSYCFYFIQNCKGKSDRDTVYLTEQTVLIEWPHVLFFPRHAQNVKNASEVGLGNVWKCPEFTFAFYINFVGLHAPPSPILPPVSTFSRSPEIWFCLLFLVGCGFFF